MLTQKLVRKILQKYAEAWVEQDIPTIRSIFHRTGIYHENVLKKPFRGHQEIAHYWKTKVCEEQSKIKFKLLHSYICENTIIAEWEASFNSNIKKARVHLKEVAIMEIKDNKIKSLREYWHSEKSSLK